jgi:hypothetical protein
MFLIDFGYCRLVKGIVDCLFAVVVVVVSTVEIVGVVVFQRCHFDQILLFLLLIFPSTIINKSIEVVLSVC